VDASNGYIAGNPAYMVLLIGGTYFRTVNGGDTWLGPPENAPELFDLNTMRTIAFGNATEGMILRGGNLTYHTVDAGATWQEFTIPLDKWLSTLTYGDENVVYAVGDNGAIVRWDRVTPVRKSTWGSIKSIFSK
jgi:photosystem II stability/assembly factor-like uncharacterized protein